MAAGVVETIASSLSVACSIGRSSSGISFESKHQIFHASSYKGLGGISLHSLFIGRRQTYRGFFRACENKRSNPLDDPFNFGEDEDMEDGELMSTGKQSVEVPKPPTSQTNENGYLDFPEYYNLEIANLGLYIRNDVRRCLCWVAGGVYENLLFFPAIQLLRNRYPGVKIDVVAGERGKQAYEMNKYINKAIVFNTDADWTVPADLVEFLGVLRCLPVHVSGCLPSAHGTWMQYLTVMYKTYSFLYLSRTLTSDHFATNNPFSFSFGQGEYYDLILSTTCAGFKHCATLFMIGGRTRRASYVTKYHSDWVSNHFLTEAFVAPRENLAEGGYDMYEELMEYIAQPSKGVPRESIPPLQIGVPKRVRSVVEGKMNEAGISGEKYVVFHGIMSHSAASMTSRGDTDSLLPLQFWDQLRKKLQHTSGMKVVVVIPLQRERERLFEAWGQDVSVMFISTPGQLASLVRDSTGVVCTNTAAMLMAVALNKPCVALFGSAEKASLFVPPQAEKIKVVASITGKLTGVEVEDAYSAWSSISEGQLVLAA